MEAKLTRAELVKMGESMGVWIEGRTLRFVDCGNNMMRMERDKTITPAGENILAFVEAAIAETERRLEC